MPDYGIDTPQWSPLPWSWAVERLDTGHNYWVMTVSAAGRPHALPVWGVWDDAEQRFCFSCAPGARKAANLAANPRMVLACDDTVECLSVDGRAAPVTEPARQQAWIDRYLAKYQGRSAELSAEFLRANLLVEFVPERAFGVREAEFPVRATRWRWPAVSAG
jgi:hypothetical protein